MNYNVYYISPITGRNCRLSVRPMTLTEAQQARLDLVSRLQVAAKLGLH